MIELEQEFVSTDDSEDSEDSSYISKSLSLESSPYDSDRKDTELVYLPL